MRSGLRYHPFSKLEGTKTPGYYTVKMPQCPCCGKWVEAAFQGHKLLGVKHATFAYDLECPYVQWQNANPMNRFQRLSQDYEGMEDRLYSAREAVKRAERRESRLDGRPQPASEPEEITSIEEAL